jgi:hypothetical protein
LECVGKQRATPLLLNTAADGLGPCADSLNEAKGPSTLRSAGALRTASMILARNNRKVLAASRWA